MSILNRLNLLIRSNFNDAINSRNDTSVRGAFREMESSLRDARRQQVELRAGEKRLIAQIRAVREQADQWEDRAVLALRHGDEELAREALIVKNRTLHEANRLRDQLDEHRAYMRDISSALEALEMKLESTRGRMQAVSQERQNERSGGRPRVAGDGAGSRGATYRTESDWDAELRRRTHAGDTRAGENTASSSPSSQSASPREPITEYDRSFDIDPEL